MHGITPLQTHGLYREVWRPPKTRFVTYEAKDRDWCVYCGIGTMDHVPEPLYDVRGRDLELIGYTRANPAEFFSSSHYVNYLPECFNPRHEQSKVEYESIRVDIRKVGIPIRGETFYGLCFCVLDALDASKLIASGWIECIGVDKMSVYRKMLAKHYEQRIDRTW